MPNRIVPALTIAAALAVSATARAQDKIGVAECDDYLAKVQACVSSLSAAQSQQMSAAMEQMRTAWRGAAQTAQGKTSLAAACKQAADMAKAQYAALGCKW